MMYRNSAVENKIMRPYFGNAQQNYSDRPTWRPNPNRPRQFQQWNHSPNPRFYQQVLSQRNNEEYWCETCDRGFPRIDILENHKQQHQKCNIDGCQFIAHPKVITKHIQMQHSTGLFKKIAVLNNPEEIQKWIQERKKKYPTKDNVEKKEAEAKEKVNRGEKLGMKNKRFENKNKSDNMKRKFPFNNDHRDFKQMKKNTRNANKPQPRKVDSTIPLTADNKKLKPFAGIQYLVLEDEEDLEAIHDKKNDPHSNKDLIEDLDNIENIAKIDNHQLKDNDPTICGALSSLICNYGSSDEEECPKPNMISDISLSNNIKNKQNDIVNEIQNDDDDSGPEEVKAGMSNTKEDNNLIVPTSTKSVVDKKYTKKTELKNNKRVIPTNRRPKPKLPSTLLQKLLHTEIRQERNKVLQCIRYIVRNNYFDYQEK